MSPSVPVQRTKLALPRTGNERITRKRLVDALIGARDRPLVLLDAPVGYGKTMLLVDWLRSADGERPFAWVSLDAGDSDPGRFLAHMIGAIRQHAPGFGDGFVAALPVQGASLSGSTVPRLLDELAELRSPMVIALDDYHLLAGRLVHELVEFILNGLPATIQLAVASRADPPLPLARLRATGALLELRAHDLRFDEEEADALLRLSGVVLDRADVVSLVDRCEGWPAGIYLAALALRSEPDVSAFIGRFAGTHRHVADYLSEQVFSRQPDDLRAFLVRTSVLDRMCGRLCDAVLESEGSQAKLEELERSNLFVVPLDDERIWFRYHHLFGEMLRAELARTEPSLASELHRRASAWFEGEGLQEEAIEHALAARDERAAGELIMRNWLAMFNAGRIATIQRWLDALGEQAIAEHPSVALVAGWVAALTGRPEATEQWLRVAERRSVPGPLPDGTASIGSGVAMIRGLFGYRGLQDAQMWLTEALEQESEESTWWPVLQWGLGHVYLLSGDASAARDRLREAIRPRVNAQTLSMIMGLAELALAEIQLGEFAEGLERARQAETLVDQHGLAADTRTGNVPLAIGLALVREGKLHEGDGYLERALQLRRFPGRLSPWPTLQALVSLAPVRIALGDKEGGRDLLDEARAILATLEDAGDIPRRVDEAERLLHRTDRPLGFGEHLTDREIAILRLLPSGLSQREIGSELFLSLNTVKSHARAIYRKMGVRSREEAVRRARELELL